jgi:hypothetical protein
MLRFQHHWIITIKGKRKRHFTASDETGLPLTTTLCKTPYDPMDRTSAERGTVFTYNECQPCLKVLFKALITLKQGGEAAGMSGPDAAAFAALCLHLKIDKTS